jgi:hypothetical protein
MVLLGGWWKYLVSDVTLGAQGNDERLAFLYDARKLQFGGLAGELVPAATRKGAQLQAEFAFARTPYLVGFRAGWFKCTLCADHLYYGDPKPDDPQRVKEARLIVELLRDRMNSKDRWANNVILVGDFNVFSTADKTFAALTDAKFKIPAKLVGQYTNAKRDKPFDQMAFLAPDVERQMAVCNAGVFPFFDYVYRDADSARYPVPGSKVAYTQWRTYQMSDHLPIWVELKIDFGQDYLERKTQAPAAQPAVVPAAGRPAPGDGHADRLPA